MDVSITGRCMCGSISYHCASEPKFTLICQCRQCQRITGTGHAAQFAIDEESTVITGSVQTYDLTSDAGSAVKSAFCPTCGNPIYKTTSMMPGALVFHVATLDEPSAFKPQMLVHVDSAQPWDYVDPAVERRD